MTITSRLAACWLLLVALCFSTLAIAQNQIITGTVRSNSNEPLPGVNVTVKGGGAGTTTDAAGKFSIRVSDASAVLVFSYVGRESVEQAVGSNRSIDIQLKESAGSNLQDVVVVGFGTQRKTEQTAAISTIKASDIVKAPVSDVTNALTGRIAGVLTRQPQGRPGASTAEIYIRGRSSTNSAALIIVDGVERESFGDIDPNDIESISTLKDAASTALFGLKGANGVIVVTTKRGREGKPQISYSGSVGLNTFGQIPRALGSYESVMLHNEGELNLQKLGFTINRTFSDQDIETFRTGTGDPLLYPDVDWVDELTRKAWLRTQHNLSFRGGSRKASYFVSLGYLFEDGMFKQLNTPQGFKTTPYATRGNFRANLDYNLTSTTKLSLNLAGRTEFEYTPRFPNGALNADQAYLTGSEYLFYTMYRTPSWAMPFFPEYATRSTPELRELDDTYNQINSVGFFADWLNPYLGLKRGGYAANERNIFESTFIIDQKLDFITKGLAFNGTFAYDQRAQGSRILFGSGANYTVDRTTKLLRPSYPPATATEFQIEDGLAARGGTNGGRLKTNILLNLNYNRQFGDHKASGAVVATREFEPIAGAVPRTFQGLVFKTAYNYAGKYFLELNGSYQGSENYAKDYRYGFFPTVGLGYTLTEEKFFRGIQNALRLSYLKFRGSYGLVGFGSAARFAYRDDWSPTGTSGWYFGNPSNIGAGAFDPRPGNLGQYPAGTITVVNHSQIGNPFAAYEKSLKRNLGVDAYFFRNQLQLTVDVFDDKRYNILYTRAASTLVSFGEGTASYNFGENYNSGIEVEMKYNSTRSKNWDYGIALRFSHIQNVRRILDEPVSEPAANLRLTGTPIGQFRGYATAGLFQNQEEINKWAKIPGFPFMPGDIKLVDLNGDGLINNLDFTNIGYSDLPVDQYSAEPYIGYKSLRLSALFQAVDKVSSEYNPSDGGLQYYPYQLNRWRPDNTNTDVPAIRPGGLGVSNLFFRQGGAGVNATNLQNASFIKLRNVELSYQAPSALARKVGMNGLNLSLTGQNLYTWTKFMGLDPENNDDRSVGYYVLRGVTYPNIRTFQLNIRATF